MSCLPSLSVSSGACVTFIDVPLQLHKLLNVLPVQNISTTNNCKQAARRVVVVLYVFFGLLASSLTCWCKFIHQAVVCADAAATAFVGEVDRGSASALRQQYSRLPTCGNLLHISDVIYVDPGTGRFCDLLIPCTGGIDIVECGKHTVFGSGLLIHQFVGIA